MARVGDCLFVLFFFQNNSSMNFFFLLEGMKVREVWLV